MSQLTKGGPCEEEDEEDEDEDEDEGEAGRSDDQTSCSPYHGPKQSRIETKATISSGPYDHGDHEEEVEEIEVKEGDLKTLDALLPVIASERRTLAKIVFSRLDGMEPGETVIWEIEQDLAAGLDLKAVELYTKSKVGVLTRYESGPLPNAFKISLSFPA
ncbi:hypothetical protein FOMPIDRAFT_1047085 [Fomitopsis schrenkii]|uniref:Uncharacterized protein n=1 Tax=Fomitopsis schrenkii TaxID=2126942 RepID=S8EIE9_FOMSC|nr:hypothetical protein FOMPIDRAFT_1047085 [Fomitopsis schrenkii]